MQCSRRGFLGLAAGSAAGSLSQPIWGAEAVVNEEKLQQIAAEPVLRLEKVKQPVIIESLELLRRGKEHFLRVRSRDGIIGVAVDDGRMGELHPILKQRVIPYFVGKDARDLEEHLFQVYRYQSNYKLQGLALWCPVALVEFAILDLLGQVAGLSLGELLGGVARRRVPFYVASGRRDTTPEEEIDYLRSLIEQTGAGAVKYRLGGRMSRNADALPGRSEGLIRLSRKALGDKIVILADANSSYDAPHAIEIGRMLEGIGAVHFEEPCPFDNYEWTKRVSDTLTIPVALGEQEYSEWRFQVMIRERVADVVQPDLFYYGGMVRSMRVARMAASVGLPVSPHLSGGFGFVYLLHFVSAVSKMGARQEYKKGVESYGKWFEPALRVVDGELTVPTGKGTGFVDRDEILKGAVAV
jgi:L-alanine-DL-glutamate epimerase-like enolase superfamily enzyme